MRWGMGLVLIAVFSGASAQANCARALREWLTGTGPMIQSEMKRAQDRLERHGVRIAVRSAQRKIEILPEGSHPLNQFARAVKLVEPKTVVYYDAHYFNYKRGKKAQGAYWERRLLLRPDIIDFWTGEVDYSIANHELLHLIIARFPSRFGVYGMNFYPELKKEDLGGYGKYFSLGEVLCWLLTVHESSKLASEAEGHETIRAGVSRLDGFLRTALDFWSRVPVFTEHYRTFNGHFTKGGAFEELEGPELPLSSLPFSWNRASRLHSLLLNEWWSGARDELRGLYAVFHERSEALASGFVAWDRVLAEAIDQTYLRMKEAHPLMELAEFRPTEAYFSRLVEVLRAEEERKSRSVEEGAR